jgi:hypothetical protein
MVVGLLSMAAVLIAMGWFAIGWVARGHENRKYAESRLRHFANQAIQDQLELSEGCARWESERVHQQPPAVVNVYVAATGLPARPQPPVIDAQVIPALPSGESTHVPLSPRRASNVEEIRSGYSGRYQQG